LIYLLIRYELVAVSSIFNRAESQNDHSGKLGYEEFKKLWTDLRYWKVCIRLITWSRRR